jgi:hypothetical protein
VTLLLLDTVGGHVDEEYDSGSAKPNDQDASATGTETLKHQRRLERHWAHPKHIDLAAATSKKYVLGGSVLDKKTEW